MVETKESLESTRFREVMMVAIILIRTSSGTEHRRKGSSYVESI